MWIKSALKVLSGALAVFHKLVPSWEWKGGQASEQAKGAKEADDARNKMAAVPSPSADDVAERLRKGKF